MQNPPHLELGRWATWYKEHPDNPQTGETMKTSRINGVFITHEDAIMHANALFALLQGKSDDATIITNIELMNHLKPPITLRACEGCGGPGPCLHDPTQNRYSCRKCHSTPDDAFFTNHAPCNPADTIMKYRKALEDIAGRWEDDTPHSLQHRDDCEAVVCVAKRALAESPEREPMEPLKTCANGCIAPVCPPSKAICRSCMDKITANLEKIGKRMDAAAHEQNQEVKPSQQCRTNHIQDCHNCPDTNCGDNTSQSPHTPKVKS